MLLSQQEEFQNKLHEFSSELIKKVLLISGIGHIVLLFMMIFAQRSSFNTVVILLEEDIPLVVASLHKHIEKKTPASSKVHQSKQSKKPVTQREYHPATAYTRQKKIKHQVIDADLIHESVQPFMKGSSWKIKSKKSAAEVLAEPAKTPHVKHLDSMSTPISPETDANPIYIGRDDLENYQFAKQIRSEIKKYWQAPGGFNRKVSCVVKVSFDDQGNKKILFIESSQIPAFDLAVKAALNQAQFPLNKNMPSITLIFE